MLQAAVLEWSNLQRWFRYVRLRLLARWIAWDIADSHCPSISTQLNLLYSCCKRTVFLLFSVHLYIIFSAVPKSNQTITNYVQFQPTILSSVLKVLYCFWVLAVLGQWPTNALYFRTVCDVMCVQVGYMHLNSGLVSRRNLQTTVNCFVWNILVFKRFCSWFCVASKILQMNCMLSCAFQSAVPKYHIASFRQLVRLNLISTCVENGSKP